MVESYTLSWLENKLIVTFIDGVTKEYVQSEKDAYLADYPDRVADVVAMGWGN